MRRSSRIFVVVPVAALVALIVFAPGYTVQTTQAVITSAAWPFLKFAGMVHDNASKLGQFLMDQRLLRRSNAALQKQLEQTSVDTVKLAELRSENERLKNLLQFRQTHFPGAIAARVIGYDPSGWTQSLLIDKGTADGILVHEAVICPAGAVGRIFQTGPYSSKVLLVTDPHIRVGAMLENSRDIGILEGHESGRCRVLYLPRDTMVELGQRVLTSGLGGIFPKGLVIGKVIAVGWDELGLYQNADVEPSISVARLEEVLILKGEPASP